MIAALRRWARRRRVERWRRRAQPSIPALATYLSTFEPLDEAMVIDDLRFVVLDIEASGLNISQDRILTLAAIVIEKGVLVPAKSLDLMVAEGAVGAKAAPVHGLIRADLVHGAKEVTVLSHLLALLGNSVFVAHHAAFDMGILNAALKRYGGAPLLNDVVDTEALVRRLTQGPVRRTTTERFSLDAVAERYGLETEARHTAAGDTLLTAELLLRLLAQAKRAGIQNLGELLS